MLSLHRITRVRFSKLKKLSSKKKMRMFNHQNLPDTLRVKVTPNAKSERIKKETAKDKSELYKIYVTASPEAGKANDAAIKLLAKALGVPKSALSITRGHISREKTIKINVNK